MEIAKHIYSLSQEPGKEATGLSDDRMVSEEIRWVSETRKHKRNNIRKLFVTGLAVPPRPYICAIRLLLDTTWECMALCLRLGHMTLGRSYIMAKLYSSPLEYIKVHIF